MDTESDINNTPSQSASVAHQPDTRQMDVELDMDNAPPVPQSASVTHVHQPDTCQMDAELDMDNASPVPQSASVAHVHQPDTCQVDVELEIDNAPSQSASLVEIAHQLDMHQMDAESDIDNAPRQSASVTHQPDTPPLIKIYVCGRYIYFKDPPKVQEKVVSEPPITPTGVAILDEKNNSIRSISLPLVAKLEVTINVPQDTISIDSNESDKVDGENDSFSLAIQDTHCNAYGDGYRQAIIC